MTGRNCFEVPQGEAAESNSRMDECSEIPRKGKIAYIKRRVVGWCKRACMDDNQDEYAQRKLAGEEAGDMLSEEARLCEMGLSYPLNMMHTLYYEMPGDAPEELRPRIVELVPQFATGAETRIKIYEQQN